MIKTIELDCPPGAMRPGSYIKSVVTGTCLYDLPQSEPEATTSRVFGNWTWSFPNVSDEDWLKARPTIKMRIEELYRNGLIRYGSW